MAGRPRDPQNIRIARCILTAFIDSERTRFNEAQVQGVQFKPCTLKEWRKNIPTSLAVACGLRKPSQDMNNVFNRLIKPHWHHCHDDPALLQFLRDNREQPKPITSNTINMYPGGSADKQDISMEEKATDMSGILVLAGSRKYLLTPFSEVAKKPTPPKPKALMSATMAPPMKKQRITTRSSVKISLSSPATPCPAIDFKVEIAQEAGVVLPKNWPPRLCFIGDNNVNTFPSYDKLHEFYLTNSVEPNKKVVIGPSPVDRGLGLFAAKTLYKGEVVGYYSGLLRRQQAKHDSEYVANWRPIGEDEDGEWELDAKYGGNEMRFGNHPNKDEKPNMKANCTRRNKIQVIAFKAISDIEQGTELLWDYGDDYFVNEEV